MNFNTGEPDSFIVGGVWSTGNNRICKYCFDVEQHHLSDGQCLFEATSFAPQCFMPESGERNDGYCALCRRHRDYHELLSQECNV